MPLEYYPPVTNMLNCLGEIADLHIKVWTTKNVKRRPAYKNTNIAQVQRLKLPKPQDAKLYRLLTYLRFNIKTFWDLLFFSPDVVLYYESYSAGPVYWYFRYFGKNKKLFIHYHEYFDQAWYNRGMAIVKQYYKYEKEFLWHRAQWISHTNTFRRDLLLKAYPLLQESKIHVLPNYPPSSWYKKVKYKSSRISKVVKTVYVGSLSLKDTFIKPYCDWLLSQNGNVILDVYAYNLHKDTLKYLKQLRSPFIRFFEDGLAYEDLPKVLPKYDIGLILYKGNTPNYIYNAPNKLFEYMACGLEVWVPQVMIGCQPYLNIKERPIVRTVDYTNLNNQLLIDYHNHLKLPIKPSSYNCDTSLLALIQALKQPL